MTERSAARQHAPIRPVEPVHWGARLVRAPGVVYTEVAGVPVLVRVDDAELQPLPPAWAGCWAALDGRPVAEALDVDPTAVDPITSRNLIEVLRRLKAERLVVDVGSLDSDDRSHALSDDPTDQSAAGPTDIAFHGRLERTDDGTMLTIAAPPGIGAPHIHDEQPDDDRDETVTMHLADLDGSLTMSVAGAPVHLVFEGASTGGSHTPSAVAGEPAEDVEGCVIALAGLLAALDDPACLAEPGVVDLLAALAEQPNPSP